MVTVVLVEPENAGNVGAIARCMKNFGLKDLVLVNPLCDCNCSEAIARSKHAKDVLDNARVVKKIPSFDCLVATTSQVGSDYNIPRSPVNPEQLAEMLKGKKGKIAILFGREGKGLSNIEIESCDFIVTIESSKKYPVLNVSHSASIIFYELFKKLGSDKIAQNFVSAGKVEKDQIMKMLKQCMNKLPFKTSDKKSTQVKVWKRLIGKSFLTKREAYAVMGFFRKILQKK